MRLFVFNCLLLASVAVASPNGRHKRDLKYLKNLIASAIFGGSQTNIQPAPVLLEENGYKLFQLPRYDDVMIKVAPKKPVVEEFVYSPAVGKVNLNAFGTVVGTKSKDDTLVAVKDVNNLLSTGILYGGQYNLMKETVVPMFPSLNTPNYVVEEKIKTAPVIKTRPVFTEVIETRPVMTEVVETRPVMTEVVETRPVMTEVVETRPVMTEVVETRPIMTEVVETRPVMTEVVETRPVMTEIVETRPVMTEVVETRPVMTEVVETRPVMTEVVETRPVMTEVVETRPVFTEVVETRPVFTEEIRAVEENIEPIVQFKPTYSYKQILNNEPVMMYTEHNIPGVELVETIKTKTELPKCIKKKVDEAIVMGAGPNRFAPVQDVFQYQSPLIVNFPYPRVEANAYVQESFLEEVPPVQKVYQYQSPSFVDFSYPRVEANSHVNNSFRGELKKESDVANSFGLTSQRLRPSKDSPARSFVRNLRPTKTKAINPRPNPLHSHISPHFEQNISASKDKVNPPTMKVQAVNKLGEKDDFPKTLGEYIALVNNRGRNSIGSNGNMKQNKAVPIVGAKDNRGRNSIGSNGNMKQNKAVPIVGAKDNVSNAKIPINVYKLQRNPNTGKVVEGGNALRTNVKTNANQNVNGTAVNSGNAKKEPKKVLYSSNKVTPIPQSITSAFAAASTDAPKQPLRENIQTSIVHEPTVVKNNGNYSYPQKNADGSFLNVNGNKPGVSANVNENNNGGRGDIPDQ